MGPLLRSAKFRLFFGFVLLFVLSLGLSWPGSQHHSLLRGDERQHTRVAFNLLTYRVFHDAHSLPSLLESGGSTKYMRYEPGYSLYLAAVFSTVPGFDALSVDCILDDTCQAAELLRGRIHQAGAVLGALLVAATFLAAYTLLRSWPLSIAAGLLVMLLLPRDASGNLLIALFLLTHVVLAAETWRRPRIVTAAASGVALGLLVLTEAVFQYWLIGLAVLVLIGLWQDSGRRPSLARPLVAMMVLALVLTLPWMFRNLVEAGRFGIAGRDGEVLAIRAEFGRMTWPEVRGAFAYFLPVPGLRERAMPLVKPETFGYSRFRWDNPEGFYLRSRSYHGDVAQRADQLSPAWRQSTDTHIGRWEIANRMEQDAALRRAALELMREDWPKHVVLTVAFAERGSDFRCRDYGHAREAYGLVVDFLIAPLYEAAKGLSLLFIPVLGIQLFIAAKRRSVELALLALPVAWAFGIQAAATQFEPRNAEVLTPVLTLLLALAIQEFGRWSEAARNRRLEPLGEGS